MAIDIYSLSPAARQQILSKLSEQEKAAALKGAKEKRSKYNAKKTARGNIVFDSRHEAERFDELILMQKAGLISDLKLQHSFTISEAYTAVDGERIRAVRYVADFTYTRNGVLVVEDAKSPATRTPTYKLKRKLMLEKFGIKIQEV